ALPAPAAGTFSDMIFFPYGLFRFTINGVTPGGATQVTLVLSGNAPIESYWKYGKEPGNITVHPYEFMRSGGTGAEIMRNTIILHFIDGQRGDDDLDGENGVIFDDGGPASPAPAIPALTKKGLMVFVILLSLFAWWMIRRGKLSA
ncbi:MAG: hypothetical protein PHY29_09120, partial [Syntrophales bacterium]|nr:hypothetical protein [Syntrophales bacterium]